MLNTFKINIREIINLNSDSYTLNTSNDLKKSENIFKSFIITMLGIL